MFNYSAPERVVEYCDDHFCLFVSLSTSTSPEIHVLSSPVLCVYYLWAMAISQSSFSDVVKRYVLPVLWMMSCLHTMARNRWCNSVSVGISIHRGIYLAWCTRGQNMTGGGVWYLRLHAEWRRTLSRPTCWQVHGEVWRWYDITEFWEFVLQRL